MKQALRCDLFHRAWRKPYPEPEDRDWDFPVYRCERCQRFIKDSEDDAVEKVKQLAMFVVIVVLTLIGLRS